MDIEKAIDRAIDDMPKDYEIRLFLIRHRAEVKDMCITEYNEAETMQMIREESREEGENKRGSLISILFSKGRIEDAQKVATDKTARSVLYKEFNIL